MDERMKSEYRKIYSELTTIIMVIAAVSLVVKFSLLHMEITDCITEFIILVFSPLYVAVRQYMKGLDPNAGVPKRKRKTAFLCGILTAAVVFIGTMYWQEGGFDGGAFAALLIFLATFAFVYFAGRKLGEYFSEKKAKKYED